MPQFTDSYYLSQPLYICLISVFYFLSLIFFCSCLGKGVYICLLYIYYFLLKDYRKNNPEVAVLDPPDAIEQLLNRQSMLNDVTNLNLSDCYGNLLLFLSSLWGTFLFQLPEL